MRDISDGVLGHPRSAVLSACQVAIYDPRRGSKHKKLFECSLEDSSWISMSEQALVDGNTNSKFYARLDTG